MIKLKIRRGATVQVIAGAEKGKQGKVIALNKAKLKVKVEGIKVMTHFDKKEGVLKKEAFFDYSNVKLIEQNNSEPKTVKKKKTSSRKIA